MKWLISLYVWFMTSLVYAQNQMLWGQKDYNEKPKSDWTLGIDFILLALTIFYGIDILSILMLRKNITSLSFSSPLQQ